MQKNPETRVLMKMDSGSEPYKELLRGMGESISAVLGRHVIVRSKLEDETLLAHVSLASCNFAFEAEPFVFINHRVGNGKAFEVEVQTRTVPGVRSDFACNIPFTKSHKLVKGVLNAVKKNLSKAGNPVNAEVYPEVVTFYSASGKRVPYVNPKEFPKEFFE